MDEVSPYVKNIDLYPVLRHPVQGRHVDATRTVPRNGFG